MSRDLVSLVLDRNDFGNDGLRELANGMIDRFNSLDRESSAVDHNSITNGIYMPLQNLSIRNTAFTDVGFKFLI